MRGRGKVWQSVFERSVTKLRREVASSERQKSPQKVLKRSPMGHKVNPKRSQSGFQEVPKWFPRGSKLVSKRLIQHSGADEDRFDKGCTGGWPPS